jgi:hypothetical protein
MQPGDLVRIRYLRGDPHPILDLAAAHAWLNRGKVGVVVAVDRRHGGHLAYDVLLDGSIAHFGGVYLELINEAG